MRSSVVLICAAALSLANGVNAFFVPAAARLVGGASSASRVSHIVSTSSIAHGARCSCASCAGVHGRSCSCPSCSSAGISGRSCSAGCRCTGCSMRMKAQRDREDTTSPVGQRATCQCPDCGVLKSRPRSRGAASSVMMMSMGGGEGEGVLRQRLADEPESVQFEDTMAAIAEGFDYVPKRL
ncbi:expressed unknown protein [Ectocarpus siliculosus]|uniref:Uncharacterized protein n=1 Tax=Ectocarpus siliculosus TaxID=2880 RepID=D8LKV3_ECTSI|nr:expressed unknown protein [Ectocarpus siliculosus]|eukprot:CBN80086.1 expressed unknown protein [Ectocarpus siliculosus]